MICVLMSLGGEAVRASSSVFAAALFFAGTDTSDAAKPTVTEGDPSRILQWPAVHVLNAFEY